MSKRDARVRAISVQVRQCKMVDRGALRMDELGFGIAVQTELHILHVCVTRISRHLRTKKSTLNASKLLGDC